MASDLGHPCPLDKVNEWALANPPVDIPGQTDSVEDFEEYIKIVDKLIEEDAISFRVERAMNGSSYWHLKHRCKACDRRVIVVVNFAYQA